MKPLLFIAAVLLFVACKKEEDPCRTCRTALGYPDGSIDTVETVECHPLDDYKNAEWQKIFISTGATSATDVGCH